MKQANEKEDGKGKVMKGDDERVKGESDWG